MLVKNDFGVWQIDLTVDGKRCRKSTRTKDKTLAQKLHALTESDMLKGTWGIGDKSYSLKDAFVDALQSHWKDMKSVHKVIQNWSLLTEPREGHAALLDESKDVSSVTPDTVRDLFIVLGKLGNSNATANRKMAVLKTLLNLCRKDGRLTHVPHIKTLKEEPARHRVLTDEEEVSMMRFFTKQYGEAAGLYEFLLSSGNRVSEALKLTWFDIDFKSGLVTFRDTKSGCTLIKPMTVVMKRVLEARKGLPVPFPYTLDMVEHYWKHFRKSMGVDYVNDPAFVIHSLRHTCASRLVIGGMDLLRVQMWLGHKSYETTRGYAQLETKHLKDVVTALNDVVEFDYSLSLESQSQTVGNTVALLKAL